MAKLKIREAIRLAESGYTREDLIEHFGVTETEYKQQYSEFSKPNKEKLRALLIGNGRRKNKNNYTNLKKEAKPIKKKIQKNVVVWDTSYILSDECGFDDPNLTDTLIIILPQVYEQLVIFEKRGKSKIKKLFHYILEEKINVNLESKSYVPDSIPDYEDVADIEIVEYSKVHKGVVVYTADKALALRCKQQKIDFKFIKLDKPSKESKNIENQVGQKLDTKDTLTLDIFVVNDGVKGINPRKVELVYDKNFKVKKQNKYCVIPFEIGYIVCVDNKMYKIISKRGELEELIQRK